MRHFLISGAAVGALFLTAAPVATAKRAARHPQNLCTVKLHPIKEK